MSQLANAKFRATTGTTEAFGTTSQEALDALIQRLSGDSFSPIFIWPYNLGDAYFTDAQQAKLQDLKSRQETLIAEEHAEWEELIGAALDAAVARTQAVLAAPTGSSRQTLRNNG